MKDFADLIPPEVNTTCEWDRLATHGGELLGFHYALTVPDESVLSSDYIRLREEDSALNCRFYYNPAHNGFGILRNGENESDFLSVAKRGNRDQTNGSEESVKQKYNPTVERVLPKWARQVIHTVKNICDCTKDYTLLRSVRL